MARARRQPRRYRCRACGDHNGTKVAGFVCGPCAHDTGTLFPTYPPLPCDYCGAKIGNIDCQDRPSAQHSEEQLRRWAALGSPAAEQALLALWAASK